MEKYNKKRSNYIAKQAELTGSQKCEMLRDIISDLLIVAGEKGTHIRNAIKILDEEFEMLKNDVPSTTQDAFKRHTTSLFNIIDILLRVKPQDLRIQAFQRCNKKMGEYSAIATNSTSLEKCQK